jgi:predicted metalloprotease with PDZ domain
MRIKFTLILLIISGLIPAKAISFIPPDTVNYRLIPIFNGDNLASLEVEIKTQANQNGTTLLELPDHYAGSKDLYAYLKNLTIDGAETVDIPELSKRLIHSKSEAKLVIRYHLEANLKKGEEFLSGINHVSPQIGPDRFYILGPALFATIKGRENATAKFQWKKVKGWAFASDLERLSATGATMTNVFNSVVFCGRDLKIATYNLPKTELRIAYAGQFAFSQEDFNSKIIKAISAEQQFWGDGQKSFLVTMVSSLPSSQNSQILGMGLNDAFAMMIPRDTPLDPLVVTLLHEYFHNWNPLKILGSRDDDDEIRLSWFVEGFTDYYARKLGLRSGLITLDAFVSLWNEVLAAYTVSSAKTLRNEDTIADFWSNKDVMQLPYQRGAIFAAFLNYEWHEHGVGMDQFMLALRDEVKSEWKKRPKEDKAEILGRFQKVANRLGVDLHSYCDRFIETGEALTLPENAFGGCIRVETNEVPIFDIGFDAQKTAVSGVFSNVDLKGLAYAAGLRDGMKRLEHLSGSWGNINIPVSFRVLDLDGNERVISYLPLSQNRVMQQRLVIPEGLSSEQLSKCAENVASY